VDPERYGIVTSRRSFHDFRLACRTRTSFLTDPGYYIPGYAPSVSDERSVAAETQRLRCELACFLSPHLTQEEGRRMCEEMAAALPSEAPDCGHLPVDR